MKGIKDLTVIFRDTVGKEIAKNTWQLMEELFANYHPVNSLIDQAITEGLTTVEFTHNKDRDVPTGGAHIQNENLIKIDASMHPADIISVLLFELFNSVNSELKQILEENYDNSDDYANAMEFSEYKTYINYKKLILNFLQINKEKVEKLLIQSGYPEPYTRVVHNIKERITDNISSEDIKFIIKHREMYVQDWERWNKIFTFKEISKVIKEQDSQKLAKLLSSSHIIVEQNHINEAIDVGNVENLKLLLNKYTNNIFDSQLIKAIDKPELLKLLLPYLSDIDASYCIAGTIGHFSKTGNISAVQSLLNEYKGKIRDYDLPAIRNKTILDMVKNYPNFVSDINTDQDLIGIAPQDNFDLLV